MADDTPKFGWLDRIVGVQWDTGDWVAITIDICLPTTFTATLTLPGVDGWSPGIDLAQIFPVYPHIVTEAEITARKRTLSGADANYFGVSIPPTFPTPHPLDSFLSFSDVNVDEFGYQNTSQLLFRMPTRETFNVRVDMNTFPLTQKAIACVPVKRTLVKKGLNLPVLLPAPYPSPLQASWVENTGSGHTGFATFRVDPKAMTAVLTGHS